MRQEALGTRRNQAADWKWMQGRLRFACGFQKMGVQYTQSPPERNSWPRESETSSGRGNARMQLTRAVLLAVEEKKERPHMRSACAVENHELVE